LPVLRWPPERDNGGTAELRKRHSSDVNNLTRKVYSALTISSLRESCILRPIFASLEGIFCGGFTVFDGKSTAVGMPTKIRISKIQGVLADFGVARQAFANIKTTKTNFSNLAFSSVCEFFMLFHMKTLSGKLQDGKSVISLLCYKGNCPLPIAIYCTEFDTA